MVVRISRRLLAVLMTLILVVGSFGSVSASWMCEGRVCSPDLARCCCVSAADIRDNECFGASAASPEGSCEGKCGCKAVMIQAAPAPSVISPAPALIAHAFDLSPALPPTALVLQAFVLLKSPQVRPLPPPEGERPSVCIERASLRAPPAATS